MNFIWRIISILAWTSTHWITHWLLSMNSMCFSLCSPHKSFQIETIVCRVRVRKIRCCFISDFRWIVTWVWGCVTCNNLIKYHPYLVFKVFQLLRASALGPGSYVHHHRLILVAWNCWQISHSLIDKLTKVCTLQICIVYYWLCPQLMQKLHKLISIDKGCFYLLQK